MDLWIIIILTEADQFDNDDEKRLRRDWWKYVQTEAQ